MKLTDKELIDLINELHGVPQAFDDAHVVTEPDTTTDRLRDTAGDVHQFLVHKIVR